MQIGPYKLTSIQTGLFKLDGGAMFGVVPKNLWTKTNPSDEQNRIEMCTRALLLQGDGKNILIDTGIGYKLSEKLNKIYDVDYTQYTLEKSLKKAGLKNEDITDVILTHLHFDHAGGNTYLEDGKILISFPNALYHVQKRQYDWALNPTERDKASFFPDNYKPLSDAGHLKLIDGNKKFDSTISFIPLNGHTNHMQAMIISDGSNTLFYTADLVPTAGHIPAAYIMGYDLFPLTTLHEKKEYLTKASKGNWILFFEHDPFNECAYCGINEKGYFLKERFILNQ